MYSYGSKKKMKLKKYFCVLTRSNNKNLAIGRIIFQNLAYLGFFFFMGNPSYRLKSYFSSRDFFHSSIVPNGFPMCSPKVFPAAPHLNPICFAQSAPLLTYIGGPKGEALDLSIGSCILGSLYSFNCFFVMGPWNWFIATKKKEKSWTCEAPPTN
jgi:hypothetical protein